MHTPLRKISGLFACALLASAANAQQVNFNEIYASHTGVDDQEYIELIGTPGMSLSGYMVLIIEGDTPLSGNLDRAWDLTGYSVPTDGYFLMADPLVTGLDYDISVTGPDNNIENGTQTYYLLWTDDPALIQSLLGADLDVDGDLITDLNTLPSTVNFVELVGVYDPDFTADEIFDGALGLGPDLGGPYLPAGIFKPDDNPNGWCTDDWLDFFLTGLTPGSMNPSSSCTQAGGGSGGPIGTNYCGPGNVNSTGLPSALSAFGSTFVADNLVTLTSSQLPLNQFGYYITSQTQGFIPFPGGSQGNLCLSGSVGRYSSSIGSSGSTGLISLALDLSQTPQPAGPVSISPGESWNWQLWHRDQGGNSNFTDGIQITFQ